MGTISQVHYNAAGQLASVTKNGETYTYEHAGVSNDELLEQETPDGSYHYAYGRTSPQGVPTLESVTHDGNTADVLTDPRTGQALMLRSSDGMQSMYIHDGTPGSMVALITSDAYQAAAYAYDPYGLPTLTATNNDNTETENPYGFANGIQDRTTGWVHYANRYYDPTTGTWTQRDTLDTPLNPNNANRYAYAAGDPINNTDPTGRRVSAAEGCAVGAVTAAIGGAAAGAYGGLLVGGVGALPGAVGGLLVGGIGGCAAGAAGQALENYLDKD